MKEGLWGRAGPLVLARFLSAGITFCIPLVLARALALEEYGTYKQLFLISQTLYYVLPFGVAQSLYYFIPRADERRAYFGQTLLFLAAAAVLACAAILALADPVARHFQNPGLADHSLPLALYTAGLLLSYPLEIALTSQGQMRRSAVVYLGSDAARALALTLPILLGAGLGGAMWAMAAFAVARAAVTVAVLTRRSDGPLFERRLFVTQLLYAAPFGLAMLVNFPQQAFHQYVVSASVPPEVFAIYAVGCFQLPLVDLLYTPTSEVLMVRLGELDRTHRLSEAVHAFRDAAARLAYCFLPMAAFLWAAAPEFIGALFGQRFLGAVPVFRVGVLSVVLSILPLDGTLRARGFTRAILASYLVKLAVTVPVVLVGVKAFGMLGGIAGWAVAECVGKGTLLLAVPRALSTPERRVTLREVIPFRALGKASAAAAVAALGVVALRWGMSSLWHGLPADFVGRMLPLVVAGVLFCVGYAAMLWVYGIRVTELFASLRRRRAA